MDKNNIKKQNSFISEEEKTLNWEEIQSAFKKTFGSEVYNSWLQKISLVIVVPNAHYGCFYSLGCDFYNQWCLGF